MPDLSKPADYLTNCPKCGHRWQLITEAVTVPEVEMTDRVTPPEEPAERLPQRFVVCPQGHEYPIAGYAREAGKNPRIYGLKVGQMRQVPE